MADKPKRSVSLLDDGHSSVLSSSSSVRYSPGRESLLEDKKAKKEKKKKKKEKESKKEKKEKEDRRSKYRSRSLVDLHSSKVSARNSARVKKSKKEDDTDASGKRGTVHGLQSRDAAAVSMPILSLDSSMSSYAPAKEILKKEKKKKKKEKKEKESESEESSREAKSDSYHALVDSGSRQIRHARAASSDERLEIHTMAAPQVAVERKRNEGNRKGWEEEQGPLASPNKKVATLFLEEFGITPTQPKQHDGESEAVENEVHTQSQGEGNPIPAEQNSESTMHEVEASDEGKHEEDKEKEESNESHPSIQPDEVNDVAEESNDSHMASLPDEAKESDGVEEKAEAQKAVVVATNEVGSRGEPSEADIADDPSTLPKDESCESAEDKPDSGDTSSCVENEGSPKESEIEEEDRGNQELVSSQTSDEAQESVHRSTEETSEGSEQESETLYASAEADQVGSDQGDARPTGTTEVEVDQTQEEEGENGRRRTGTQSFFESMKQGALKMEASMSETTQPAASIQPGNAGPGPTRSVAALAQALQAPQPSSPPPKPSQADVAAIPKRNVLERAKFLQTQPEVKTSTAQTERKTLPGGGNVLERAKFLQTQPESEKESRENKLLVEVPRGSVLVRAQSLLKAETEQPTTEKASRPEVPRGKVLEKAQFLTTPQQPTQRKSSVAEELLGSEPRKVNPTTVAMFDNILQQMVRHGGTDAKPPSGKSRSRRTNSVSKSVPVPPARTGSSSTEAPAVPMRSPGRKLSASSQAVDPDSVHVVFSDPDASGARIILLGTIPGLIDRLTCTDEDPVGFDRDLFIHVFLLVHPLFVSSTTVLEHLRQTYTLTGALPSSLEDKNKNKNYRSPAVRVIQILTEWADRFPLHFANDKAFMQLFESWIEELKKQKESEKKEKRIKEKATVASKIDLTPLFTATANLKAFVDSLENELKAEEAATESRDENSKPEGDDGPLEPAVILKELSAKELAHQLTLIDYKTFSRIGPSEYFHQNWVKHKENAKNLSGMIRLFNEVSLWVMTQIVSGAEVKDRAKTISKFINAAKEMKVLNNYNGVMVLLSALNNSSIRRLTAEWELLGSKAQQTLDTLYELLNPDENFGNMRNTLAVCAPPVIPFMGFYLTQVTYIDENDDTRDGMVNFNKMMMFGKILLELNRFQSAGYTFKPNPQAQSYFLDRQAAKKNSFGRMRWLEEKGIYERSLAIKPRGS